MELHGLGEDGVRVRRLRDDGALPGRKLGRTLGGGWRDEGRQQDDEHCTNHPVIVPAGDDPMRRSGSVAVRVSAGAEPGAPSARPSRNGVRGRTTGAAASSRISSSVSIGGFRNTWRVLLAGHVTSIDSTAVARPRPMCWV